MAAKRVGRRKKERPRGGSRAMRRRTMVLVVVLVVEGMAGMSVGLMGDDVADWWNVVSRGEEKRGVWL